MYSSLSALQMQRYQKPLGLQKIYLYAENILVCNINLKMVLSAGTSLAVLVKRDVLLRPSRFSRHRALRLYHCLSHCHLQSLVDYRKHSQRCGPKPSCCLATFVYCPHSLGPVPTHRDLSPPTVRVYIQSSSPQLSFLSLFPSRNIFAAEEYFVL